jgi:hypothetical protein
MRVLVAASVAVAVLAGCVGLDDVQCRDGEADHEAMLHTPWVDGGFLRTDPDQDWDTLVLQEGGDAGEPSVHPSSWDVETDRFSAEEDGNFSLLRVSPGDEGGRLDLHYHLAECEGMHDGTISWELAPPSSGDSAQPGQGVHVYTAGFWENGTLFYTNIEAIDHSDWPRAAWYAWEGKDTLPVYVYDQDRGEQPVVWKDPQAGTPLEGTVPGLGYFTTIPGFNDALKGLSTNTVRVVRMEPEDAYTRAGNEKSPLYGDALVFYIKVVDVVDLPCPMGLGRLCGLPMSQS